MEHIAHAVADAAEVYGVPVLGLVDTLHEKIYGERGVGFQAEFFADLDYDDDGTLIITRQHAAVAASGIADHHVEPPPLIERPHDQIVTACAHVALVRDRLAACRADRGSSLLGRIVALPRTPGRIERGIVDKHLAAARGEQFGMGAAHAPAAAADNGDLSVEAHHGCPFTWYPSPAATG